MRQSKRYKDIDEYIAAAPKEAKPALRQIRKTIHEAAPEAVECISYLIPTFKFHGNLVHFAVFRDHIGFYPTSSGVAAFEKELSGYSTSRGTVRFPLDRPVPYDLVKRITEFRVRENTPAQKRTRKGIDVPWNICN